MLKKTLIFLLGLIAGLLFLIYVTGHQYLIKGVYATYVQGETSATISDLKFFDSREISAGKHSPWDLSMNYNEAELSDRLLSTLESNRSVAFMVIKNDSILYEQYWDDYSDSSLSNSFSMAKSIVTMLAQIAIQEGHFKSWDDDVQKYLPKLKGEYAKDLKLRHLSTMTAGLDWNEHYKNPFDITAKAYYSSDVPSLMYENVPAISPGGEVYQYQSGSSQLLGMAIASATGLTLSEYASQKLWKPMGAAHAAQWHLDSDGGTELSYCCFNSNARDFARFGKLLINNGKWNGTQLIDSSFIAMASLGYKAPYYGYSFWLDPSKEEKVFYMRGILGQYVIVLPESDIVIVRLGHQRMPYVNNHPGDFHILVEEVLQQFGSQ